MHIASHCYFNKRVDKHLTLRWRVILTFMLCHIHERNIRYTHTYNTEMRCLYLSIHFFLFCVLSSIFLGKISPNLSHFHHRQRILFCFISFVSLMQRHCRYTEQLHNIMCFYLNLYIVKTWSKRQKKRTWTGWVTTPTTTTTIMLL